jgi:hypothetical protein
VQVGEQQRLTGSRSASITAHAFEPSLPSDASPSPTGPTAAGTRPSDAI